MLEQSKFYGVEFIGDYCDTTVKFFKKEYLYQDTFGERLKRVLDVLHDMKEKAFNAYFSLTNIHVNVINMDTGEIVIEL